MAEKPTKRPIVTYKAEPQPAPQKVRGGTHIFEVRDSWAPALGKAMERVHRKEN